MNMSDYNTEFARINKGRRVRIVPGAQLNAHGDDGVITGSAVSYGHVIDWRGTRKGDPLVYHQGVRPEDLDPIDGLGPLLMPGAQAKPPYVEAWRAGGCMVCGKPYRHGKTFACTPCEIKTPQEEWVKYCDACEAPDAVSAKPATKAAIVPAAAPTVETVTLPRASLERIANFLNTWQPVAGAKTAREREAVECVRLLKQVLWPAKGRDVK